MEAMNGDKRKEENGESYLVSKRVSNLILFKGHLGFLKIVG